MNTAFLEFLLQNPAVFFSKFIVQPLGIAAILYGIVWWTLRPRAAKGLVRARHHWLGIVVTVLGSSLIRVMVITHAGASALDYDSGFSMVVHFIGPPAIVAASYVLWLLYSMQKIAIQKALEIELSPLLMAAAAGDNARVRSLVSSGESPNATGPDGQTGIMLAARNGHVSTVSLLLSLGASPRARTKFGNTARDIAAKFGHKDIEELLERAVGSGRGSS